MHQGNEAVTCILPSKQLDASDSSPRQHPLRGNSRSLGKAGLDSPTAMSRCRYIGLRPARWLGRTLQKTDFRCCKASRCRCLKHTLKSLMKLTNSPKTDNKYTYKTQKSILSVQSTLFKTELKHSPFKAWRRLVYSHTCYAYSQEFLPHFYPSSPFTCVFSKTSPDFFLRWLWLTPVPV